MIQTILTFVISFLLLALSVGFGAVLLTVGFNRKDQDFVKAMEKFKSWKHSASYNDKNKRKFLLDKKNTDKEDE